MAECLQCRAQNPPEARFCSSCGAPLRPGSSARPPVRKLVTVVFTDLTGFTGLSERLDPERLRGVISRYFEEMRSVVERHEGTVEKFVGDAVMAVFGVPHLHEDDALRATRAAAEMRDALEALNDELEREWGVRLQARTGVNTGEVVSWSGDEEELRVLGDTVNVAARLQQSAQPQQVLLGEPTYRLVKDSVEVEVLEPLALKGKEDPVRAFRLLAVGAGPQARRRRLRGPLVGREPERDRLRQAFEQASTDRTCFGLTVVGSPGLGKSRLADEFVRSLGGRATVLHAQCLSYGKGVTFWPVRQLVRQAAEVLDDDPPREVRAKIASLLRDQSDGELIVERLSQLLGVHETTSTAALGETFWAVRKLLETMGRERPVVALFDDIHWAEPTLLDLIEHIWDWCRDAPVLVVCLARPELLDQRPGWGADRPNSSVIRLAPLSEAESETVIRNMLGSEAPSRHVLGRINQVAEGNPLFIEEIVSMLVEEGVLARTEEPTTAPDLAQLDVPPSLHALLAARVDRLDPPDRQVIEVASVIGMLFDREGLLELLPGEYRTRLDRSLQTLAEKEFIRPAVAS